MTKIPLALAILSFSPTAFAATTDSISLSGVVASLVQVDCTDVTANSLALDLDGASADTIIKVSDCASSTNDDSGISLVFTDGNLTKAGTSDVYAFEVHSVADAAGAPTSGDFATTGHTTTTSASGAHNRDIYIMFTGSTAADPGTYTGTISVTASDRS